MRRKHEYIGLDYMTHYTKTIEVAEKKFGSSSIRRNKDQTFHNTVAKAVCKNRLI